MKDFVLNADLNKNRIAIMSEDYSISYYNFARLVFNYSDKLIEKKIFTTKLIIISIDEDIKNIAIKIACAIIGVPWVELNKTVEKNINIFGPVFFIHDKAEKISNADNELFIAETEEIPDRLEQNYELSKFPGFKSEEDTVFIGASSGSTGDPKLIARSVKKVQSRLMPSSNDKWQKNYPITANFFPPTSAHGYRSALSTLNYGGTIIFRPTFNLLQKTFPDLTIGTAVHYSNAFKPYLNRKISKKLPVMIVTGSPVSEKFVSTFLQFFVEIQNRFGSSETGLLSVKSIVSGESGPISVGVPLPGVEIEIADESGNVVTANCEGNLRVRTSDMISEYVISTADQNQIFIDGWFYPGDRGYYSESGEFFIVGRTRDTINLGGMKINPQTIDESFEKIQGISECLTFAYPDDTGVNILAAIFILEEGFDIKVVINNIFKNLKAFDYQLIPKEIFVCDVAPRNANGKKDRLNALDHVRGKKSFRLYDILVDIVAQIKRNQALAGKANKHLILNNRRN